MPPKRKDRGWAARSPCKCVQSATSTNDDLQPVQHQSTPEIALFTATLKQLLLSASSLRFHLKKTRFAQFGQQGSIGNCN